MKVAILGIGPSIVAYTRDALGAVGAPSPFDEVWAVNRAIDVYRCDRAFVMDDFRWIEQHDGFYAKRIQELNVPVFTSTVYEEYPTAEEYPLEAVESFLSDDIGFSCTIGYALSYALYKGVTEVAFYGCDFWYPQIKNREEGGQAVAFLCGVAKVKGVQIRIPHESTLLNANWFEQRDDGSFSRKRYGFHRKDEING